MTIGDQLRTYQTQIHDPTEMYSVRRGRKGARAAFILVCWRMLQLYEDEGNTTPRTYHCPQKRPCCITMVRSQTKEKLYRFAYHLQMQMDQRESSNFDMSAIQQKVNEILHIHRFRFLMNESALFAQS